MASSSLALSGRQMFGYVVIKLTTFPTRSLSHEPDILDKAVLKLDKYSGLAVALSSEP